MPAEKAGKVSAVAPKVGFYVLLGFAGWLLLPHVLLFFGGYLIASAVGVFLTAAIANWLAVWIFERAHLADIGLLWNPASARNLLCGLIGGAGGAGVVLVVPLVVGLAELQPVPDSNAHWRTILFVSVVLVFGAVGEEMLFRGYGFQVLLAVLGPFATILPVSVLFGILHSGNPNISTLGLVNTVLWGVLLGCAFLRSGDLWLPIGLHLGWNWTLPLFGVNLSGFTMRVTGYAMHWKIGPMWSGGEYGPEGGILTTAILVALSLYLWKAPIRQQAAFLLRSRREA
jgi:membrane protease YdiL (CAAX protease family)